MTLERLQKILAAAGLGSRRACEELILQGRVKVDGRTVTELGSKADPDIHRVECDGEPVRVARKVYFLVNKPRGVVCTSSDEYGRPRVVDMLPVRAERLFTVGRLDADTEGMLIVTNDGDFAQRVAHPRYGVTKTYRARVNGNVSNDAKRELLTGVWVGGHCCRATEVKIVQRRQNESLLEITMQEGRNREVRRMLAKAGHPVLNLQRTRIGPLSDPALKPGRWRKLRPDEIARLIELSGSAPAGRPASRKGRK